MRLHFEVPRDNGEPNSVYVEQRSADEKHCISLVNLEHTCASMVTLTTPQLQSLHTLLGEYLAQTTASGTGQSE